MLQRDSHALLPEPSASGGSGLEQCLCHACLCAAHRHAPPGAASIADLTAARFHQGVATASQPVLMLQQVEERLRLGLPIDRDTLYRMLDDQQMMIRGTAYLEDMARLFQLARREYA